jgi:hypothetical protein
MATKLLSNLNWKRTCKSSKNGKKNIKNKPPTWMLVNTPLFTRYLPCEQVVYTYVSYIKLNQLATSLGHLGNCVAFMRFWSLIAFFSRILKTCSSSTFKLVSDQTLKHSGQAGSKGRALLFLVSKQNLKPFS